MTVAGSCHCHAVRIVVPAVPDWVAACNCSICRKLGWLVAYYDRAGVTVEGSTVAYLTGDRLIEFHHCPVCGAATHWQAVPDIADRALDAGELAALTTRIGINARLLDCFALTDAGPTVEGRLLELRYFDNAAA